MMTGFALVLDFVFKEVLDFLQKAPRSGHGFLGFLLA